MTERCKKIEKEIKNFEKRKGGSVPIGTKTEWSEYFGAPFTDEEREFVEKLGYRYLGQGVFSGAFGVTDHQFEYIGLPT